MFHRLMNNPV